MSTSIRQKFSLVLTAIILGTTSAFAQSATLTTAATTYAAGGGSVTLTATISYATQPTALGFEVGLPEGWSYTGGASEPSIKPDPGTTGTLEWAYTGGFGTGSSTFTFTVSYPPGLSGSQVITASAVYRTPLSNLSIAAVVLSAEASNAAPSFTTHPADRIVNAGADATFSVVVAGTPTPNLQWQVSTDAGTTWGDVTNTGAYSGATTGTLAVTGATVGMNGYRYRALASNTVQSNVASNPATLTVSSVPTVPVASLTTGATTYTTGGGVVTFTAMISYPEQPTALGFEVGLPDGWSYAGGTNEPSIKPEVGTTGTLEWAYTSGFGTGSSTFTFSVNYPPGLTGDQIISASAVYRTPLTNLSINSLVISAGTASGFAGWQQAKFNAGELTQTLVSGPTADPDGDGFSNLTEYALGLEPKVASTGGLPEMGTDGTYWLYTYTRPADRTDVTCEVEFSTNLTTWTTIPLGTDHALISTDTGVETWRAKYPLASASNLFYRLKVSH